MESSGGSTAVPGASASSGNAGDAGTAMPLKPAVVESLLAAYDGPSAKVKLSSIEDDIEQGREAIEKSIEGIGVMLSNLKELSATSQPALERLRRLHTIQRRAREALERVEDVIEQRGSMSSIQAAMESGDVPAAVAAVKRWRSVETLVPADPQDVQKVRQYTEQLVEHVEAQFEDAVKRGNAKAVTTACGLLDMLEAGEGAKAKYLAFLKSEFLKEGQHTLSARGREDTEEEWGETHSAIVNAVSSVFRLALDRYEETLKKLPVIFAVRDDRLTLLELLFDTAQSMVTKELQVFHGELRKFHSTFHSLPSPGTAVSPTAQQSMEEDAALGDAMLDAVVLLMQRCVSFVNLTQSFAEDLLPPSGSGGGEQPSSVANFLQKLRRSDLQQTVHELAATAVQIEEKWLAGALKLAKQREEVLPDTCTTTIVEDTFFVLQKASTRAVAGGSVQVACGIMNLLAEKLQSDVLKVMKSRCAGLQAGGQHSDTVSASASSVAQWMSPGKSRGVVETKGSGADGGGGGEGAAVQSSSDSRHNATILNNLDLALRYTVKLTKGLQVDADEVFVRDKARIQACMSELTSVIGPLRRLCESSAAAVAKSLLPTLIAGVSCMEGANAPVKYVLSSSEEEYARTGNPVFKQQVISACEKALGSYQPLLLPDMFALLMEQVASALVARIINVVRRRRFNLLGALAFDMDVRQFTSMLYRLEPDRAVVSTASPAASQGTRRTCAKLHQMCSVLQVESVGEAVELWESGLAAEGNSLDVWQWSGKDIPRLLALRTDLPKEEIQRLELA